MRVRLGRGRAWRRWRTSAPLHLLCTCSAPALHPLSSRAAAPAPLHNPLRTRRRLLRAARAARRLAVADRARAGRPDRALLRHAARRGGAARYRGDIAEISRRYRGDSSTRSTASRCRQQSARLQPRTSTPCAARLQPCVSGLQACVQDRVGLTPVPPSSASRARPGCRPVHPRPDAPRRAASSSASR